MNEFTAVVIDEVDGKTSAFFRQLTLADFPDDDVLVEVGYSALNYKDGLALSGNRNRVARRLPMVGGIDLAGTVVDSASPLWHPGDQDERLRTFGRALGRLLPLPAR